MVAMSELALRAQAASQPLPSAAYADYLNGLYHTRYDYENAVKAIPYFERVVSAAPQSALGYAGLAEALFGARAVLGDQMVEARASAALTKAEQLEPDSAHVHFMAGRLAANGGFWNARSRSSAAPRS